MHYGYFGIISMCILWDFWQYFEIYAFWAFLQCFKKKALEYSWQYFKTEALWASFGGKIEALNTVW